MSKMMQFRAWIVGTEPEVWRRIMLEPRFTLEQLHTALQNSFGWENTHLHEFIEKDGRRYARPTRLDRDRTAPVMDERKVLLTDVFDRPKKVVAYLYDLGDEWIHGVQFEEVVESEEVEYPSHSFVEKGRGVISGKVRAAICAGGEGACPPEDCGGVHGYQGLLSMKQQQPPKNWGRNAEEREILEFIKEWDPAWFDLSEANELLGRMRVKKKHLG